MTVEELLEKYKKKYPGVPYEIKYRGAIASEKNNKLHSFDAAPAIVFRNGLKEWYKEGKLHRENDKPAIIGPDGEKLWYKEGKRHRENDKPAVIWYDGTKCWFNEDKLHRENDKPAIIWANGEKEYWYNGKEYDLIPPEIQKKRIEKLTPKKSSKQKRREDLLKEFVCEVLST